jgi:hypothetical protein
MKLSEIRKNVKGKTLLVGRNIEQAKFDMLSAASRVEAKSLEHPTDGNVIAWKTGLLGKFNVGDFDSILLHRFLHKRVKDYIEDLVKVVAEVTRILPEGGVLMVNSFLLDDVTRNFRSADSFFTEEDEDGFRMISGKVHFRPILKMASSHD